MKKQTVQQIVCAVISLIIVIAAYAFVVGGGSVFKGEMEGGTIKASVLGVENISNINATGEGANVRVDFTARALNTSLRGRTLNVIQEIDKSYAFSPREVREGDKILIEAYTENGVTSYYFGDYVRITPLIWLGVIFCILIVLFSKTQGLKTVVSLGLTCMAVFAVLLPAVLDGRNIYLWSILICLYITLMTLTIIGGVGKKTLCAAAGCLSGVICAGLITVIADKFLNMTGLLEEESIYLYQLHPDNPIDMKGIIFAMIIIGALGAVMDVSMSISSALYELKKKSPRLGAREIMKSGFTIGGDMMGTMANTLVLAYIGSSLTCVLLYVSYNANLSQVINKEKIVAEILQALAGSMGMLLTLPLTSVICALIYDRTVISDASRKNGRVAPRSKEE